MLNYNLNKRIHSIKVYYDYIFVTEEEQIEIFKSIKEADKFLDNCYSYGIEVSRVKIRYYK